MQLEFNCDRPGQFPVDEPLTAEGRSIAVTLVPNRRARRYVLRLRPDGSARVTIPRGGSAIEAQRFVRRNSQWLERQYLRMAARPTGPREWLIGTEILLRGEPVKIEARSEGERVWIRFGGEVLAVADPEADLRSAVEQHLWRLAAKELPPRVLEFAALHRLPVRRVAVRNQKSRWGSCSRRGTISLNWRLIQAPAFVRDYLVVHEIMHLKEMNHSSRFWSEVERAFPDYETAEQWLKRHASLLN